MKIGILNINSLRNKINELEYFLNGNNFHVFSLNETKVKDINLMSISNYSLLRNDRTNRGGGVAINFSTGN